MIDNLNNYFFELYNELTAYDKDIIIGCLHAINLEIDTKNIDNSEFIDTFIAHPKNGDTFYDSPKVITKKIKKITLADLNKKVAKITWDKEKAPNADSYEEHIAKNNITVDNYHIKNFKKGKRKSNVFYAVLEALNCPEVIYDSFAPEYNKNYYNIEWLFEHASEKEQKLLTLFALALNRREDFQKLCDELHLKNTKEEDQQSQP